VTSEQRRRVRDLFEAALDRQPTDVRAWIVGATSDDLIVRDEVLSLLDYHSRAGGFLAQPAADRLPELFGDDEPLPPGTKVGAYTIKRELGRGGMGRVYLASDARLGRTVALKALPPHLTHNTVQRERLRREARAAASLTHPGICTVYALEEIDGDLYIASEFIDGHTLRDEIDSRGDLDADRLLRTARELAEALASAHARGVVHRDLKPENIMRTRDGRVKVLDFGLARSAEIASLGAFEHETAVVDVPLVTEPGIIVGTPAYMAPEQRHHQPVDARADVFAYGIVMYEYACGVHPIRATSPLDAPSGFADVVARCIREIPAERYASALEIVKALDALGRPSAEEGVRALWWRIHQLVVVVLYAAGAALAWQLKDWVETPVTVSLFLALGGAATVGGVLRGHLVFTDVMNRARLLSERRRAAAPMLLVDLLISAMLLVDGVLIGSVRALPGVFTVSLGVGIALAALVLEPATTAARFGDGD
jgi:hypothetical protein